MKFKKFMRFPLLGYKRYLYVFLISLTLIQGNPQACLEVDYTTYIFLGKVQMNLGELTDNQLIVIESILGAHSTFRGRVVEHTQFGPYAAVVLEVV